MTVEKYLKEYGRELYRELKWLQSHGVPMAIAYAKLTQFAEENYGFENGHNMDMALLEACHKGEMLKDYEGFRNWWEDNKHLFKKRDPWYKRLWRLILGQ